jgi:hypothetical protein
MTIGYLDEFMFADEEAYQGIQGQVQLSGRVGFFFSTPPKKDCWGKELLLRNDRTVAQVHLENICPECRKKPAIEAVKCLHQKNRGSSLHSSKVRQQMATATTGIDTIMRDTYGVMDLSITRFFIPKYLDRMFNKDTNTYRDTTTKPEFHMLFMDPNAGGNCESAMVGGYFVGTKWVITFVYSAKTKPYDDFIQFVFDCLRVYHEKIRKGDVTQPILLAIESQKAWDGSTFFKELRAARLAGNLNLQNIHLLADRSKQDDKDSGLNIINYGVCVDSHRQNDMVAEFSRALKYDCVLLHQDICTVSEWGVDTMLSMLKSQLSVFEHFDKNTNSGHTASGKPPKNNDGKKDGKNDDLADAILGLLYWWMEVCTKAFYRPQMSRVTNRNY